MSSTRSPYPSDVSDEEWAFVVPYLSCCLKMQRQADIVRGNAYACLFDRPERTLGARGGCGSAHARSCAPLWSGGNHCQTRSRATARDRLTGAQAHPGRPRAIVANRTRSCAPGWKRPPSDGAGAVRLVGGADGAGAEEATLWRAIRRLGWTHNKRLAASERDEAGARRLACRTSRPT